ncbi:MAG: cupredoxin domain-containing protein [Gaiellaceae bacterium]
MLRRLLPLAILSLTLVVLAPANAAVKAKVLTGTVGPGYTITLKSAGKVVKTLAAGTYIVKVADKASIHNFHFFGPGVNKKTSITGSGSSTWTVKLKRGTYTYQCDVHAATGMKGTFRVK